MKEALFFGECTQCPSWTGTQSNAAPADNKKNETMSSGQGLRASFQQAAGLEVFLLEMPLLPVCCLWS